MTKKTNDYAYIMKAMNDISRGMAKTNTISIKTEFGGKNHEKNTHQSDDFSKEKIVRCIDCKYGSNFCDEDGFGIITGVCSKSGISRAVEPGHYCSYGILKPKKTYLNLLKEHFPDVKLTNAGYPAFCPKILGFKIDCDQNHGLCWFKSIPYEENKKL